MPIDEPSQLPPPEIQIAQDFLVDRLGVTLDQAAAAMRAYAALAAAPLDAVARDIIELQASADPGRTPPSAAGPDLHGTDRCSTSSAPVASVEAAASANRPGPPRAEVVAPRAAWPKGHRAHSALTRIGKDDDDSS